MNLIGDLLERFPASKPLLLSISAEGERRVWHAGELIAMSAGLSGAFAARGVRRGDVVMTLVGNRVEWVLALLACWRMGATALPCSTQLRRADLAHRAATANPALCIGSEDPLAELPDGIPSMTLAEVADVLDEDRPQETPAAIEDLGPDDPALIVFTSGTTGEPRAALHAQRYLTAQRSQAEHWLGATEGDLVWCTTGTGWSKSARNIFLAPWLCGAAAVLHERRFDPAERLDLCEREQVSVLCQAPTEYRMLVRRAELRPLPALRRAVSAGEALDRDAIDAWRHATGLEIHDGYGQTETGHLAGSLTSIPVRPGSMGKPLPGFDLRIANGELEVRVASCPTFFARYLDSDPFAGEWWPTGDLVREDADGYLWHQGRRDDLIVSAGYRIGPQEVEAALASHPAVAEAAAVPAPDRERGAVVKAVVVLDGRSPSAELARELQDHVKAVTAPYKFPRIVEFAESLPRTSSGKLRRAALRTDGGPPTRPAR
ncbi:MAG TPA: AMP-binding protein [Solirubrobacterales bacterium]|nr:AMP-binding protein [Solirubrobacterales bacterium]